MNQRIKLRQLVDAIDPNRVSDCKKLEIVRPEADWDDVDKIKISSPLLIPFYEAEISVIGMEAKDTLRILIDWDAFNKLICNECLEQLIELRKANMRLEEKQND